MDNVRTRPAPPRLPAVRPLGALWRALRFPLLVVLLAVVVIVGWRVTRIDLPTFVTGLPKIERIVSALLQPDLVTREVTPVRLEAPFALGTGAGTPSASASVPIAGRPATITVEPGAAQPGEAVSIVGEGLPPNQEVQLQLVDATGFTRGIPAATTDARGRLAVAFYAPSIAAGAYTVRATVPTAQGALMPSETLSLGLSLMGETILLAFMGTLFAVICSVPLSFLGARNLMQSSALTKAIYYLTRTFFNLVRSIEVLIVAVIMAVVVGIGPFAGVLALVIHSIGALGKLYSEAIESIDPGPIEAITATGASRLQVVLFAVVPQVVPQFLSFTMYRWDINVRLSTVIGLVGGGGIGFLLIQYINLLQWNQAGAALWLIGIVVILMDYASATIRARLV